MQILNILSAKVSPAPSNDAGIVQSLFAGAYERRSCEGACNSGSIQIRLLTYFRFGEAQCASCGLSPTLGHAAT